MNTLHPRPEPPLGDIPGSFVALYRDTGPRARLTLGLSALHERYDYCEDLAQLLVDTARHAHLDAGLPESDVLERIALGLQAEASGVDGPEGRWVLRRLAEVLGWAAPEPKADR